ncbi:AAA family ATPase [Vineibacter terrae]|uniref:AAA family ATPase n=1 Tax=Vineibacter terrae TaxID=2586908 RepID=UPI002E3591F4|nr:AAA family ATPase [Vineibacter terrae]HEX2889502.1 AAA family ATPase [Vineibacter terrae]
MQFNKLRLSGFKSFVDPTELTIEPGMTGIVGPNGCGKSNLVEALKWVMGETSAKQMRGSEMEDVIFGGTGQRPARNIAEVTLRLDNKNRTAPATFNDSDELEVIRRIERGHGSLYKVNGRETRARDVQVMFADAASGARSTAMVSQGRIGAIINAKPQDRRNIIDEAAGITGLYSRRHEAELRLKAAEANLLRVQDVLAALEEQHRQLKRQARQASRYRNLSDHIRRAEAAVLALRLAQADQDMATAAEELKNATAAVADLTRLAGMAATAQAESAANMPALRHEEAAAAAKLQRLRVAHETLADEMRRVQAAREEGRVRLTQIESDAAREGERHRDAETALGELGSEAERLNAERVGEDDRQAEAITARDDARVAMTEAEAELDRLTRQIAADETLMASVQRDVAELNERLIRLKARRDDTEAQRRQVGSELAALPALADIEAAAEEAREALAEARDRGMAMVDMAQAAERQAVEQARSAHANAAQAMRAAQAQAAEAVRTAQGQAAAQVREAMARAEADRLESERARAAERMAAENEAAKIADQVQKASARVTRLKAEESGIAAALRSAAGSLWPPLIDALTVAPGYEAALGAAFGEELEASYDQGAPLYWQALGAMEGVPGLPEGVEPLALHVTAPPELERRLQFIGIVADEETGRRLQDTLRAGQQLVTRDGAVWRWDGFTVKAGAPTAAANRLSQRNKLAEIRSQLEGVQADLAAVETRHLAARAAVEAARQAERLVVERSRQFGAALVERARQVEKQLVAEAQEAEQAAVAEAQEYEREILARTQAQERAAQQALAQARAESQAQISRAELVAGETRDRAADVARKTAALTTRQASLDDVAAQVGGEIADLEMRRTFREARRSWIPDPSADRQEAASLRALLAELRTALVERQTACDTLAREAELRGQRLRQIETESQGWQGRLAGAAQQLAALNERRETLAEQLADLDARPEELAEQRATLEDDIAAADEERRTAADRLAEAENTLEAADKALKQVEHDLAAAREQRVRREGLAEQAERDRGAIVDRIGERLRLLPEQLLEAAEVQSLEELPDVAQAERRLERLVNEREGMGAVNLRAEEEAAELDQQIIAMTGERDDLTAAIGRLRQGIASLNREGRERFVAAFENVNRHFQELFTKLFGGGRAELRLTESEDPLEAGLEIVASPPGKKLQVMSLLSGGEQALTALSLLFAVFMTNPAPICVLDEVDAPLDDANVERFCDLVADIAERSNTRFLIITHHRVTMAKMHRLYGVTMAERGVSILVSVDLEQADRVLESTVAA